MDNDAPPFFRGGGRVFPGPAGLDHHGGPSTLAWVIFVLELLMLAALAVLIARSFMWRPRPAGPGPGRGFRRHGPPPPADPLEAVRYRYARGEITREQYLQVTRDLGGEPEEPTEELPAS
jgi:hypothetical protein